MRKPGCDGPASARNMPICARLNAQRILAKTRSSSSVSQPGVRKSRCQPSSAQRASSRAMRGRIVSEKPGSTDFTGETLMRTPRTPSLSISASSASGAFSSTSTMPRQRANPTSRIASSMQALSRP